MITPSTKITILTDGNTSTAEKDLKAMRTNSSLAASHPDSAADQKSDSVSSDSSVPPSLSHTAKILVDTIRCVQRGVDVPRSFLLSGPPGVGKTYAIKSSIDFCNMRQQRNGYGPIHLLSLRGSELLAQGSAVGQASASKAMAEEFHTAAVLASSTPSSTIGIVATDQSFGTPKSLAPATIVFIDECDALLSIQSVAAMLATILDRISSSSASTALATGWSRIIVVAATNRVDSIPVALRRAGRLDRDIPMGPPDAEERAKILLSLLRGSNSWINQRSHHRASHVAATTTMAATEESKHSADTDGHLRHLADICVGYVLADLLALVRRAAWHALQEEENDGTDTKGNDAPLFIITPENMERAMKDVGASALRDASLSAPPRVTWDDIAGDPGGAKVCQEWFDGPALNTVLMCCCSFFRFLSN